MSSDTDKKNLISTRKKTLRKRRKITSNNINIGIPSQSNEDTKDLSVDFSSMIVTSDINEAGGSHSNIDATVNQTLQLDLRELSNRCLSPISTSRRSDFHSFSSSEPQNISPKSHVLSSVLSIHSNLMSRQIQEKNQSASQSNNSLNGISSNNDLPGERKCEHKSQGKNKFFRILYKIQHFLASLLLSLHLINFV